MSTELILWASGWLVLLASCWKYANRPSMYTNADLKRMEEACRKKAAEREAWAREHGIIP